MEFASPITPKDNTFSEEMQICNTLNSIRQEAALLCRQPEGYDGGAA